MSNINQEIEEYYQKSRESGVYFHHVKNAPDKPWDYEYLFQKNIYPALGKEKTLVNKWLDFFPPDKLNFSALSQHHYICQEWLDQFPEAPWVLEKLRRNKNFNFKMLLESKAVNYLQYDWSTQTFGPKEVTLNSYIKVLKCNWHPQNYRNYPMRDSWLVHIPETEDIYCEISGNRYLKTSWLQAKPDGPWDISKLVNHKSWCFDWLLIVKSDKWALNDLSSKPHFTFEVLKAYPQGDWNFRILSMRNDFSIEWVDEIPDGPWDFATISKHLKLELSWVKNYPDKGWDFSQIGRFISLDFEWAESFPDANWNFHEITPNIKEYAKWIEKYPNQSWDYSLILKQPDMTLELLKIIPEEKLDFDILSSNYKLNLKWLKAFPNRPWHFHLLSVHKNITLKWIDSFPEANWCFNTHNQDELCFNRYKIKKIGINPGYNGRIPPSQRIVSGTKSLHDFYRNKFRKEWFYKYPDLDWDYSMITTEVAHDISFLKEYPNKPWDFKKLSKSIVVTTELLKTYPDVPWNMNNLAQNYNIKLEWLGLFDIGKWDFSLLSSNPKCDDSWILKYPQENWEIDLDSINEFKTLAIYQFYHQNAENTLAHMDKIYLIKEFWDSPIPLILMHEENKRALDTLKDDLMYGLDISKIGFWMVQEMNMEEKWNVFRLLQADYNFSEFYPEVVYNMDEPLELQDLSGKSFLVEYWFDSEDIIGLIYETHPELQGVDFVVPQNDEEDDYKADRRYNEDFKYYLLKAQSGPFSMVFYGDITE